MYTLHFVTNFKTVKNGFKFIYIKHTRLHLVRSPR